MDHQPDQNNNKNKVQSIFFFQRTKTTKGYWLLLLFNYLAMFVGSIAASLLTRLYFSHGGSSRWVATVVQSVAFPFLFFLLFHGRRGRGLPFSNFTRRLLLRCLGVGLLTGINNFLISWGISYLPVSTSSLLLSSQLAFNLAFSVLLVRQKIRYSNLNCVVLITLASVLIALGSNSDAPPGVSAAHYFLGFFAILGAALLFAVYLPLMEIVLRDVTDDFSNVVEMQIVMQFAATAFAVAGMVVDERWRGTLGLEEVKADSRTFGLGRGKYWLTIAATVISWQLCFMGTSGVVYLTTSLTTGICMTALLPMNVVAGVVAFDDTFGGLKAVSTVLCLWGFASYCYGEYHVAVAADKNNDAAVDNNTALVDDSGGGGRIV